MKVYWLLNTHMDGLQMPEGKPHVPCRHRWRIDGTRTVPDSRGRPYCTVCGCQPCWYELKKLTDEVHVERMVKTGCWRKVYRDKPGEPRKMRELLPKNSYCSHCPTRFLPWDPWPRHCAGCGQTSYRNPTPAVVTIIPYQDGIVTIRRGNAPHIGGLALPGGYMDWTTHPEAWEETAVREAREEAQVTLDPTTLTLLGARTSPSGNLVLVCTSPRLETLDDFVPSEEATERVILRDPEQLCFPIQADFARELLILVPESIRGLIAWRDACTDRWGSDLHDSMLHWLGKGGFDRNQVPEEHRLALDEYRALPFEKQERYVRACLPPFEEENIP